MARTLELEEVDLAQLSRALRSACGPTVVGSVVGRTCLRDAVIHHLHCSQLEAETLVDTMIARGFVVRHEHLGLIEWFIGE